TDDQGRGDDREMDALLDGVSSQRRSDDRLGQLFQAGGEGAFAQDQRQVLGLLHDLLVIAVTQRDLRLAAWNLAADDRRLGTLAVEEDRKRLAQVRLGECGKKLSA